MDSTETTLTWDAGERTRGTGGFQTVVTGTAAEFLRAPQRENPEGATSAMKRDCQ